jgi:hypothetical protein
MMNLPSVMETREHKGGFQRTVTQFCSQGLGEVKLVYAKNTKWVLTGPHQRQKFVQ